VIKGWKVNPGWRHFYEARESMLAQTKASLRSVEIQEEQHRNAKQLEADQRRHWEECHAEKVAAGEIEPRKTN